ncbi:MAG: hypothetical protein Q8R26_00730 [bacterium]|nr:hypothetical protein [bacterium]
MPKAKFLSFRAIDNGSYTCPPLELKKHSFEVRVSFGEEELLFEWRGDKVDDLQVTFKDKKGQEKKVDYGHIMYDNYDVPEATLDHVLYILAEVVRDRGIMSYSEARDTLVLKGEKTFKEEINRWLENNPLPDMKPHRIWEEAEELKGTCDVLRRHGLAMAIKNVKGRVTELKTKAESLAAENKTVPREKVAWLR